MQNVDVFIGLGSRYSYLACTQLARIEAATGCSFVLHPISSIELFSLRNATPFMASPVSGQYDWDYRRLDAKSWATFYGVPFREPTALPEDHRLMARASHAAALQGGLRAYCMAMFTAVFVEADLIDASVCQRIAVSLGMDQLQFERDMDCRSINQCVTQGAREAHHRGAFGVPTFFVGDEMFWGNDRLPLVEHRLRNGLSIERALADRSASGGANRIRTGG